MNWRQGSWRSRHFTTTREGKAFYSEAIRVWLKDLKDVVYDADDIIEDFKVAQESATAPQNSNSSDHKSLVQQRVSPFIASPNGTMFENMMGTKLAKINSRLELIYRDRIQFELNPDVVVNKRLRRFVGVPTSSPILMDGIIGAKVDPVPKNVIAALVEFERNGVELVAITGMGGIGKTTLAQVVYNDPLISSSFTKKMWVCVSKDTKGVRLLKQVVEACAGMKPAGDILSTEQLQLILGTLAQGKKILLVLDDLWSAGPWENLLRGPLQDAAAGSKILITTRFEAVAKAVGAVYIHPVGRMNSVQGLFLLSSRAFGHIEDLRTVDPSLKDVGAQIVERCDGVPLAINVVGGVLRGRGKNKEEWEEVLHGLTCANSIFPDEVRSDKTMEALHLSYEDLPPHLKRCFLYLALFPEDHQLVRPVIVRQWIAEGFVETECGDPSVLVKLGTGYFDELLDRALLLPALSEIEGGRCTMHDLLRSLAQFLAEDENFYCATSEMINSGMPSKLRRLSVGEGVDGSVDLDCLKSQVCLRTLFAFNNTQGGFVLGDDLLGSLGYLRVIVLSGTGIRELPGSIRNLRHLRYLDVSSTGISELPEHIGDLRSLMCLSLKNCENLNALPDSITQLVNLTSLEAYGTLIDQMPRGIGNLTQLRTLLDFVVGEQGGVEELKPLVNLYSLSISKLERLCDDGKQARSAALEGNTATPFYYLCLSCTLSVVSAFDEKKIRTMMDVFDELCPPPFLEILVIQGYVGYTLPRWMWPSTPPLTTSPIQNLTFLQLDGCPMFCQLPPLGLLPHLKQLWIKGACVVTSVVPESLDHSPPINTSESFHSPSSSTNISSTVLFPVLEKLSLMIMPNLEKIWERRPSNGNNTGDLLAFPRLRFLLLHDCPKLRRLPDCPSSGLKFLHVEECSGIVEVGDIRVPNAFNLYNGSCDRLPQWLRGISVGPGPGGQTAFLDITVTSSLLKNILVQKKHDPDNPDSDWSIIKRFPRVALVASDDNSAFMFYGKDPPLFNTNVRITDEGRVEK